MYKKIKQVLYSKVCSKNDLVPASMGVYHEDGNFIATNGHLAVIVKGDYPAEYEGKAITKKEQIFEGKYPNYKSIVPLEKDLSKIFDRTEELSNLFDVCKTLPEEIFVLSLCERINSFGCTEVIVYNKESLITASKIFEILKETPKGYLHEHEVINSKNASSLNLILKSEKCTVFFREGNLLPGTYLSL